MAITATSGNVTSAPIAPRRPSWADMKLHYPGKNVSIGFLFNGKIKGEFINQENAAMLQNTCAIRMSHALLKSGVILPKRPGRDSSLQGGDKNWYWLRVNDLQPELTKRFKGFDAELRFERVPQAAGKSKETLAPYAAARRAKAKDFLNTQLKGKMGIVVFKVAGWNDATGHFTLWDGRELSYAPHHDDPNSDGFYFWLTTTDDLGFGILVQVVQVQFWELK